jgi:3-oxoacyl-[acyl-carrier-protein] synthase II
MTSQHEIVITGVGMASPIGIGKQAFWHALCQRRSGIRRLDLFESPSLPPPFGGVVADFDPKQYVRPRKSLKVMSREIQLGFAAADLAYVDAGLEQRPVDPERLGVIFGSDMLPCELPELAGAFQACLVAGKFDFRRWGTSALSTMYPLWMLKYLPNMPACHIGISKDARGPNNSITVADASSLLALAEAARVLERGQAEVIIAGGVGSQIHPAYLIRMHAAGLSQRSGDPAAASRPFDALRDGLVLGEGAGAFIVETRRSAEARKAPILALVRGYASAFEPTHNGQLPQGTALRRAIVAALAEAKLGPTEIGYVTAHGISSPAADRIEAEAIRETLGDVPVTAPKSYFGHLGPASGSLETIVSVLAFQHGRVPPTLNYEEPDPRCPIQVIHGEPMPLDLPTALILSYTRHGQAAAVVLEGPGNLAP